MSRSTTEEALLLERYKYVLDQKKNLNERTFKIASVYQVLTLAIVTGQFSVISDASSGKLNRQIAVDASWGLFVMLTLMTAIMAALVVGGVFAWLGYRRDEDKIELLISGVSRDKPQLQDALKWYESYILLAGAIGVGGYAWAMVWKIIPTILLR